MDMTQLEHFLSLAETKNISKSADLLFISRQGLSKSIAMLEKEAGTSLFHRTSTGLELSESGLIFYPVAQNMFQEYHDVLLRMKKNIQMQGPAIRVAFIHGFFANVSTEMMDSFFEQHPGIEYVSASFLDDELLSQFKQGNFDFAITTDPVHHPELEYYPLFRNYRCISVHDQHPLARKDRIRTQDLQDLTVVCNGPGFFDYRFITKMCNKAGFKPKLIAIRDSLTALQYAQTGRVPTLTIANISQPKPLNPNLRLLFWAEEELADASFDVNVVALKDKRLSPDAKNLIRHMQAYCQQNVQAMDRYPWVSQSH